MFQFNFIPYPLWRRRDALSRACAPLLRPLYRAFTSSAYDSDPPTSPRALADYMARWRLLPPGLSAVDAMRQFEQSAPPVHMIEPSALFPHPSPPPVGEGVTLRLPAQWETMEAVIVAFPVLYPPLWMTHLQMIEAISAVARADVLLPAASWGRAIWCLLEQRGFARMDNVRLLLLPTDDIWVRDYGPIIGYDADGTRVAVNAVFDPLPTYPQARDNAMPARYAADLGLRVRDLDLHTEGGNVWSDGAGTLLMSEDIYERNPHLSRAQVLERLHAVFDFEKLITTPYLWREETGHIDLLAKLADATTVLVSRPPLLGNTRQLAETAAIFRRETNAAGQPYRVLELPTPLLYLNWFVYPVWRSYTNALTVNGRVLVPIFGVNTDADALAVYRRAMPDYDIIPIDCRATAPGGGGVHCLTKEVPAVGI